MWRLRSGGSDRSGREIRGPNAALSFRVSTCTLAAKEARILPPLTSSPPTRVRIVTHFRDGRITGCLRPGNQLETGGVEG
jgi:hypothetical protein